MNFDRFTVLGEVRPTIALAVPFILTELAYMAMITTDVLMMGWIGPEAIAAGSLSGHFYFFFEFFALGVLAAVAPVLSQHIGARRFRLIRPAVRQGFWLSVCLLIPCAGLIWHADPILRALGQQEQIASDGQAYLRAMVWGLLPGMWLFILSEFLAAHMRPRPMLVVTVGGIALNAVANYALMFGNFGMPRLELVGAGYASALVSTAMFLALLAYVLFDRRLRRYRLFGRFWRADRTALAELVRVGMPIAVTNAAETGMFVASGLLMGLLGTTALAAHAVAAQCAAISFMIPSGLAQAAAVRVGRAAGARDTQAAARAGWTALAVALSFCMVPAMLFLFQGELLTGFFLDERDAVSAEVVATAVVLLAVAAPMQLADGLQVMLGALRGLKDTRAPMLVTIASYWGLGLPAAALFGVHWGYGPAAIWGCLIVSIFVTSIFLVLRFARLVRRGSPAEQAQHLAV